MRKIILPFFISLFLTIGISAQPAIKRCVYEERLEQHFSQYPDLESRMQELETELESIDYSNAIPRGGVITIPVVVHVLYLSEEENIPDLQVYSQIEVLNEDFRLLNENVNYIPSEFEPFAVDTEIEFCLASLSPTGQLTNGINRVQTDIEDIGDYGSVVSNGRSRLFYSNLGGADAWDTEHYLNIWVANTGSAFIGVATNIAIPDFAPEEDGIIIDTKYFGNNCASSGAAPYHLGRTATHEVGHFFSLRHPWDDCDVEDPDGVTDTPHQEDAYFGCPSYPQVSCGTSDMYMNFMNYTDDACMSMFTIGQKERMMASLAGPRSGLLESVGCALINQPEPFGSDAITVYPNPASNCIHIDFNADIPGDIDIEMVNSMGQVVYRNIESSRNFRSIDVIGLMNGVYYLSFRAAKQTITKKILVAQ